MSSTAMVTAPMPSEVRQSLMITGDLKLLTPAQKMDYYVAICDRLGMDWRTRPFDFLELNGKTVLYARKDATDQLRRIFGVSLSPAVVKVDEVHKLVIVQVEASLPGGRKDGGVGTAALTKTVKVEIESGETDPTTGKVYTGMRPKVVGRKEVDLTGDEYGNAILKAETKAKRRATLSICGLGFLDETEVDTIPASRAKVPELEPISAGQIKEVEAEVTKRGANLRKHLDRFEVASLDKLTAHQACEILALLRAADVGM